MWAAISPMSGRELEIAKQMQSEATIKVTIRWQSAFGFSDLPSMRFITSEDQILQIESALDADFMHHFITCYCILVTGQNPQAVLIDPNTTEPLLIGL
jgi:SPP1 family predicted phage head-tail adaptor